MFARIRPDVCKAPQVGIMRLRTGQKPHRGERRAVGVTGKLHPAHREGKSTYIASPLYGETLRFLSKPDPHPNLLSYRMKRACDVYLRPSLARTGTRLGM